MLAARVIAAIPNPSDVLVSSIHISWIFDLNLPWNPILRGGEGAFRLCLTESSHKEQCLSSPHTLKPIT